MDNVNNCDSYILFIVYLATMPVAKVIFCRILVKFINNSFTNCGRMQPLWSSGQISLATDPEARVRFPALPDFLRSSGSGTGSTQPREYN
jgi:hypothetical protein